MSVLCSFHRAFELVPRACHYFLLYCSLPKFAFGSVLLCLFLSCKFSVFPIISRIFACISWSGVIAVALLIALPHNFHVRLALVYVDCVFSGQVLRLLSIPSHASSTFGLNRALLFLSLFIYFERERAEEVQIEGGTENHKQAPHCQRRLKARTASKIMT